MKEASTDFKAGLERFPVRFSFQDGGIEDICLSGDEPTWVLNAKRGIISLFQNNMDDFARNHTVSEVTFNQDILVIVLILGQSLTAKEKC
jgi:hypothetical protein